MKHLYGFLLFILVFSAAAQSPQYINFQGVVRDATGTPNTGTFVLTLAVKSTSVVYSENHNITTNQLGLFNVKIGGGTQIGAGTFASIDWANGPYYLDVAVFDGTTTVTLGSQQLVSVPYALYAERAGNSLPQGTTNGQTLRWKSGSNSWAVDSNLTNDGDHVGIGLYPAGLQSRLHVTTNAGTDTTVIFGYHANIQPKGAGLRGLVVGNIPAPLPGEPFSTAIYGGSHSAVNSGNGFGVGNIGIGVSNGGTGIGVIGLGTTTSPSGTATGIYASSPGAPSNNRYAAVFDQGKVIFNDSVYIVGSNLTGATPGNVLTLSGTGRARWSPVPGGVSVINTAVPLSGGPITGSGTISMQTSGVAPGPYGGPPNIVPTFSVDAYGRIMSAGSFPFNAVTNINTSFPLTGGPITGIGSIGLAPSGVTTASYGAAPNIIPTFSVDTYGRLVSASNYTLAVPASTLNGDVKGTFLTNTVTALQGFSVSPLTPTVGQLLQFLPPGVWTPTTPPVVPPAPWIKNATTVTLALNSDLVGIGTGAPTEKLQVESTANARMSIISPAANNGALWFGNPGSHSQGIIQYDNSNGEMNFGTSAALNRIRIFGNGNLAFGSPFGANPSGAYAHFIRPGANDTRILISGGDNSGNYGGMLALGENDNSISGMSMKLDATGNRLVFYNDLTASFPVMSIGGYGGSNNGVMIGPAFAAGNAPANGLGVQGAVGIGTTAPTASLHVNGSFRLENGSQGMDRVLTSDASGNATWKPMAVGFKVEGTSSQSALGGAYTTVAYDNNIFDHAAAFNFATETYVVPSTGVYLFTSSVYWPSFPGVRPYLEIQKNGSVMGTSMLYCAANSQVTSQVTVVIFANAGDQITTRVYNNSSTTNISGIGGQQGTLFSGFKIY